MDSQSSISVAMTTFNGERYLSAQLDSILQQSFRPQEIIICDDASTDGTRAILERYSAAYPSIVNTHLNSNRLGYVKNFEKAISLCGGDLIALSDQDDIWLPQKLQRVYETFSRCPRCSLVFSDAKLIDADGSTIANRLYTDSVLSALQETPPITRWLMRVSIKGCTLAFREEHRAFYLPFGRSGWGHDDWLFFLAPLIGDVVYLADPLLLHRRHGLNTGRDPFGRSAIWNMRRRVEELTVQSYQTAVDKWVSMLVHLEKLQHLDDKTIDQSQLLQTQRFLQEELVFALQRLALRQMARLKRIRPALSLFFQKKYERYQFGGKTLVRDLIA